MRSAVLVISEMKKEQGKQETAGGKKITGREASRWWTHFGISKKGLRDSTVGSLAASFLSVTLCV